jgi:hypothetical protein
LWYLRLWEWLTRCVAPVLTARSQSAAAAGVVRRTSQCTDMRLQCCHTCLPDVVSRFPQAATPLAHQPRIPTSRSGRSSRSRVCTPDHLLPSSVDHSTPPASTEVPQWYHASDTLTLQLLVSVDIEPGSASCSSILPVSCVSSTTTHVSPPRHPLLQPGTRVP